MSTQTRRDSRLYARPLRRFIAVALAAMLCAQLAMSYYAWTLADAFVVPALERKAENTGLAIARNLTRTLAAGVPWEKLEGVEPWFDEILGANPDLAYVVLTDGEGHVLVRAGHGGEVIAPEQYVAATREVERRFVTYGEVLVGVDRRFITSRIQTIRNDTGALLLAGLVLTFELAWFAAALGFTGPMRQAAEVLGRMGSGDFRYRLQPSLHLPFAQAVNHLQDRLNHAYAGVARLAADQRRWAYAQPVIKRLRSLYRFADGGYALELAPDRGVVVRTLAFIAFFAEALAQPFLPLYGAGLPTALPGWLAGALPLCALLGGTALALPLARDWTTQAGRRHSFIAGSLIAALGCAAGAWVPDFEVFVVARATAGIGYALLLIAVLPESWAGGERRTSRTGTALLAAAFAIAQVCAPPLGGVIADTVGPRAVFLLAALLVLGAGGIAAAMLDERRPAGAGARVRFLGAPAEPPAPTRRQRALVWSAAVAGTVARFEFGGFLLAAVPLWLTATNHSTASIGRYQMALGLVPILFIPLFRKLAWRSDSYQLLLVLAVALAAGGTVPFLRPAILPGQLAGLGMIAAGITLGLTVQQVAVTRARRLMELRTFVPPTPLPLRALEWAALPAGPLAAALLLQLRGPGFALAMLAGVFIAGAAAFALVRACAGREDA